MSKPSPKLLPIMCTNGSKDGKHGPQEKFDCDENDTETCFDDSYKYCKELTTNQVITVIVMIVVALILVGVVNWVVNKIPVIGGLGVLAINLVTLIILAVIIYVFYINIRIHKTGK